VAQDVTLAETVQPVLGERRVVGNLVVEIESADAIGGQKFLIARQQSALT